MVPPKPAWIAGSLQTCSVPPVLMVPVTNDVRYCAAASRQQAVEGLWLVAAACVWTRVVRRMVDEAELDEKYKARAGSGA